MSFRHLSYILSGAAVLLLAATACTQDELADGTRLPEGEYPLIINATGLSVEATPASTRATVDGDWDGVASVALSLGDETKRLHLRREPDGAVRQPDFDLQPPHGAGDYYT